MKAAHDHLHAARKFTNFWGHQDDRKNAGRHVYQAAAFALNVHAQSMGCVLAEGCDLGAVLDAILQKDAAFLRLREIDGDVLLSVRHWEHLDAYDDNPAPVKVELLAAIAAVETLLAHANRPCATATFL